MAKPYNAPGGSCRFSALAQTLIARSPDNLYQHDSLIDGLPGFFHPGSHEPSAYPVYVAVFDYGYNRHYADAAAFAQDLILAYVGQSVRVVVDDEQATIIPPIDGVQLRRMTNAYGMVGIELSLVVQVQQQYGGSPSIGTHYTTILITVAPDEVVEINHQPFESSEFTRDELVTVMESIFETLQLSR